LKHSGWRICGHCARGRVEVKPLVQWLAAPGQEHQLHAEPLSRQTRRVQLDARQIVHDAAGSIQFHALLRIGHAHQGEEATLAAASNCDRGRQPNLVAQIDEQLLDLGGELGRVRIVHAFGSNGGCASAGFWSLLSVGHCTRADSCRRRPAVNPATVPTAASACASSAKLQSAARAEG